MGTGRIGQKRVKPVNRAVREYTEQHQFPVAAAYRARAADNGPVGKQILTWQHTLEQK
jgi:starch phosphorylase